MEYKKSSLNQVKRGYKKASYNKEEINTILDATEICNIAFLVDGQPMVQPINFGRDGQKIYIHGAHQNRMTSAIIESKRVCLSVVLLDAMKLTRSAFHHSVNYRSVVVFGTVKELVSKEDKLHGLKAIINHFVPDRWANCRPPSDKELQATRVLEIKIDTASAKIANKPNSENKADLDLEFWAGQIPVRVVCDYPIPSPDLKNDLEIPKHILDFYESRKA